MPDLNIPNDPTSPAPSPAVLGHPERSRQGTSAPRGAPLPLARRVGWVCTGESGRSAGSSPLSLLSRTLLAAPRLRSAETGEGTPKSRARAPRCPRSRLGLGALRPSCQRLLAAGPLRGGWSEGSVASSPGSPGCPESPEKPSLAVRSLFFSLPRRRPELGTAEPRLTPPGGDLNSLFHAPFSSGDSKPAVAAAPAALLSRLPGSPRAPGELGQWPRDVGALGFQHLLLSSLSPRIRAGGAAAASAVRSRRRGADAPRLLLAAF